MVITAKCVHLLTMTTNPFLQSWSWCMNTASTTTTSYSNRSALIIHPWSLFQLFGFLPQFWRGQSVCSCTVTQHQMRQWLTSCGPFFFVIILALIIGASWFNNKLLLIPVASLIIIVITCIPWLALPRCFSNQQWTHARGSKTSAQVVQSGYSASLVTLLCPIGLRLAALGGGLDGIGNILQIQAFCRVPLGKESSSNNHKSGCHHTSYTKDLGSENPSSGR